MPEYIRIINEVGKYRYVNVGMEKMFENVVKRFERIEEVFGILCMVKLKDGEKKKLRKMFSYNLVYQHYRSLLLSKYSIDNLNDQNSKSKNDLPLSGNNYSSSRSKHFEKELRLTVEILDSPELIRKNVYPEIRTITKSRRLNRSVIQAISVLSCVLVDKRVFPVDYLEALVVKLAEVLFDSQNLTNITIYELKKILKLLQTVILKYDLKNENLLKGLFKRSYDMVNKYNFVCANQEHELFCLMANMRMLCMFYSRIKIDNTNLLNTVLGVCTERPICMDENVYRRIITHLNISKYVVVDKIFESRKDLDLSDVLGKDLRNCYDYGSVLKQVKKMRKVIQISKIFQRNLIIDDNSKLVRNSSLDEIDLTEERIDDKFDRNYQDTGRNTSLDYSNQKENSLTSEKKSKNEFKNKLDTKLNRKQNNNLDIKSDEGLNEKIDELNAFSIFRFTLFPEFVEQFDDNLLLLLEKLLIGRSVQFTLLVADSLMCNGKKLSESVRMKLLGFLFACHIDRRKCKINRKKERRILKFLRSFGNESKKIFLSHLFLSLQMQEYYEFSTVVPALLIDFDISLDRNILNYFLRYFVNNDQKNLFFAVLCHFMIEKKIEQKSELNTFEKSLINLVVGKKRKESDEFKSYVKDELLDFVFECSDSERKILEEHYSYYKKGREIKSEYFEILCEFEEKLRLEKDVKSLETKKYGRKRR